jgi:hypothetical protein
VNFEESQKARGKKVTGSFAVKGCLAALVFAPSAQQENPVHGSKRLLAKDALLLRRLRLPEV